MFFKEIKNLETLEQKQEWKTILDLLCQEWENNKLDTELNLRLATECWYILSNWEFINNVDLNYNEIKNKLIEIYVDSIDNFEADAKMSCVYGYMISLFPELFYNEDETYDLYFMFEKKGKSLLENAFNLDKNNKFYKVLYLGSIDQKKYKKAKDEFLKEKNNLFAGNSVIENYFKEILGISQEKCY